MATATKSIEKVTKTVEVEEEVETIVLTLNMEEAEIVKALLGSITGRSAARKKASEIFWALCDAGVDRNVYWIEPSGRTLSVNGTEGAKVDTLRNW